MNAPPAPAALFYSYSHRDEDLRRKLETHLAPLRREGVFSEWHDHMISAGTEWKGQIDAHLNAAKVILLLISADFLASDYCYDVEMMRALERQANDEARVIPIILRPVDWQNAPFAKLQVLPTAGKPITKWVNRDEAFLDVVHGIRLAYVEAMGDPATSSHREETRQEGNQASLGLDIISKVVEQEPRGREAAARFRTAFSAACAQVDILGDYKQLHDLLHDVQLGCYNPLLPKVKRPSLDEGEWIELVMYDQQLAGCVGRLPKIREVSVLSEADLSPLLQLVPAQEELHQAVDEMDLKRLRKAVFLLKLVIGTQPARINERLIATADDLRLLDLANAMQHIQEESTGTALTAEHQRDLELGRDSLRKLHERLTRLVDAHKRWQWVDDQLHMIEESRELSQLEAIWPKLSSDIESLCQSPSDALERPLVEEVRAATVLLAYRIAAAEDGKEEPGRVWTAFLRLRGGQVQRFYNVDQELKNLCGELRRLDKPLIGLLDRLE